MLSPDVAMQIPSLAFFLLASSYWRVLAPALLLQFVYDELSRCYTYNTTFSAGLTRAFQDTLESSYERRYMILEYNHIPDIVVNI